MVNPILSLPRLASFGTAIAMLRTVGVSLLKSLSARHLTAFAILCALVVYVALILDAELIMYVAGLMALCSLWLSDSLNPTKGGEL